LSQTHFENLELEYSKVGDLTWVENDFLDKWLDSSRSIFTDESMIKHDPVPRDFEVYALVSGLPFSLNLQNFVTNIQERIDEIIGPKLHYWVKPENLGVEYCVFKWPNDPWSEFFFERINLGLSTLIFNHFNLHIKGIQINRDGCVILKGFDEEQGIFNIRRNVKGLVEFLPKKQSNWAHIPIGRILNPIGTDKFVELRKFINEHKSRHLFTELITDAKFVHETRWYMEKHKIIKQIYEQK
jgi:hypothetical protein